MIRRVFGNLYFLTFLNGFLLASLFYFKLEANYERELFQAIHADINTRIKSTDTEDSVVTKVMHSIHDLLVNRGSVFEGKPFGGIKSDLIEPTSFDLMTARGACGSFSMVLARVLQGYHYEVRIAQMKAGGVYAAHNIVEVRTRHGWVVLDPLFDAFFVKPSAELASFDDVKNNWTYYRKQTPHGYDMNYNYEGVRYTNWTKIPVILPAIKNVLDRTLGKEVANTISVRTYFLRKFNIFFNIIFILFVGFFSYTLIKLIQKKIFPQQNIPVTFSNIYKYLRLRILGNQTTVSEQGQM
jgi:hypothetical protein